MRPDEGSGAVIIGGSAAGLFVAYLLAREGLRVRVFDAGDPLRSSARTLIVTSRLTEVLGFVPSEAIVNRIGRIDLFSPRRSATIRLREPDLVVERTKVVQILAGKAIEAGAEIRGGYEFIGLTPAEDGATVTIRDIERDRREQLRTTVLVGADGGFSRVARTAARDGREMVPILQAIVRLPSGAQADVTRVWFDPETTPYFYWLIPESCGQAAVGLIAREGRNARTSLEGFLGQQRLEPLEIQAARIPLYARVPRPWRHVPGCDIYLVGDAAGQVKVTTVGGLVTGLWGARAAAEAILRRRAYGRELRSLDRELGLHRLVRAILNRFDGADYDRLLELLDLRTIQLLGRHSRDELAKTFLRLVLAQPRLLGFATRFFFRRKVEAREPGGNSDDADYLQPPD